MIADLMIDLVKVDLLTLKRCWVEFKLSFVDNIFCVLVYTLMYCLCWLVVLYIFG